MAEIISPQHFKNAEVFGNLKNPESVLNAPELINPGGRNAAISIVERILDDEQIKRVCIAAVPGFGKTTTIGGLHQVLNSVFLSRQRPLEIVNEAFDSNLTLARNTLGGKHWSEWSETDWLNTFSKNFFTRIMNPEFESSDNRTRRLQIVELIWHRPAAAKPLFDLIEHIKSQNNTTRDTLLIFGIPDYRSQMDAALIRSSIPGWPSDEVEARLRSHYNISILGFDQNQNPSRRGEIVKAAISNQAPHNRILDLIRTQRDKAEELARSIDRSDLLKDESFFRDNNDEIADYYRVLDTLYLEDFVRGKLGLNPDQAWIVYSPYIKSSPRKPIHWHLSSLIGNKRLTLRYFT